MIQHKSVEFQVFARVYSCILMILLNYLHMIVCRWHLNTGNKCENSICAEVDKKCYIKIKVY